MTGVQTCALPIFFGQYGSNFVKTIIKLAKERKTLNVVFDQIGTPTCTKDLSFAIENLLIKSVSGIYHVSNEGVCSWYDFAYEILQQMKNMKMPVQVKQLLPVLSSEFPTPAARPTYSILDKTKYKKMSLKEIPSWRDGLDRYFKES